MSTFPASPVRVAVIGAGPAGLAAAEALAGAGIRAEIFDAMPSAGRKFLMAGKSGLNLTHSEPFDAFMGRFGDAAAALRPAIERLPAEALRRWAAGLGIETFVGSSGRVFPHEMKAAPLLRAWLRRLRGAGILFHMRHRWLGWADGGALRFDTEDGIRTFAADATVLALGGASWPRLGSDAAWVPLLRDRGVAVTPLRPANCGFDVGWSDHFRERFAGEPVKPVVLTVDGAARRGEFVVTASGVEGSGVYAHSAVLRDRIARDGAAVLTLDLAPDRSGDALAAALSRSRGSRSTAAHLRREAGIAGVKAGLLRECLPPEAFASADRLAAAIKALPLRLVAPRPIEEAISTAGGVALDAVDERLMLRALPGVFCAGEMLDWEAPTGGYLLTACMALGRAAGAAAADHLRGTGRVGRL